MGAERVRGARRLVVVGGYGHVGELLCRRLIERDLGEVVVAGRDGDAAERCARRLDVPATAAVVDAQTGNGVPELVGAGDIIVNCSVDQRDPALLCAAITAGCHYADLGADAHAIAALLELGPLAVASGTRALVGIGFAPGSTNVLARAACARAGGAERVDVALILSARDAFGQAAVDWTLATAAAPLTLERNGQRRTVRAFDASRTVECPGIGRRRVHRFPFPEQFFFPETLGVADAACWCGIDPPIVDRLVSGFIRSPIGRLLRYDGARRWLARRASRLARAWTTAERPAAPLVAVVEAAGPSGTATLRLVARGESAATAACAALMIDRLAHAAVPVGVWLPESVVDPDWFMERLPVDGIEISTGRVGATSGSSRSVATGRR